MLQFRKNSLSAFLAMGLIASSAEAVIVVDYSTVSPPPPSGLASRYVPLAQTEPAYLVQRSNAWRMYNKTDPKTGAMLVYPWATGSVGAPASQRQVEVRNNISRAHVYRLR